jgi:hypothetical protein
MIGFVAFDGMTFGRRDPNVATGAPDWFCRVICFQTLAQVFHDSKSNLNSLKPSSTAGLRGFGGAYVSPTAGKLGGKNAFADAGVPCSG